MSLHEAGNRAGERSLAWRRKRSLGRFEGGQVFLHSLQIAAAGVEEPPAARGAAPPQEFLSSGDGRAGLGDFLGECGGLHERRIPRLSFSINAHG